ncbi:glycosyltransferase family 2 protein [Pseudanabaena sp. FACHB-1998]|uniref:glycosyltransferase n=1 Tax=Pseudanabaena sp. FACHB-1998 TaxID=2692858 RepID=UPI0016803E7C|nr:glycosyltransferase [Pseudanabaena sp. FACHB-1998]MBD2176623.1 glycosyltransferase family 2 protein [Pseudanabaena sp. FACHB-1998]
MKKISVIVCTHNPKEVYISKVLESLKEQTLPKQDWELLLIDNASTKMLCGAIDISWHINSRHIREDLIGLTNARLCGIRSSVSEILIFVDDDNILEPNYLENAYTIMHENPSLGSIGGKILPNFEVDPEDWVKKFWVCLALRDLGEEVQTYFYNKQTSDDMKHPLFAPIGAGMVLRKAAATLYADTIANNLNRKALDRTGNSLQSGGDCDINLTLLKTGWGVGYFPQLKLTHLISARRLTKSYLARLNYASCRSWIEVLDFHNVRPWAKIPAWSVFPRKLKSFFSYQAWKNPEAFIHWKGSCGTFEGLANLK